MIEKLNNNEPFPQKTALLAALFPSFDSQVLPPSGL